MIVIDASLVVELITAKIDDDELNALIQSGSGPIFGPELLDIEVLQALRKLQFLRKASDTECANALSIFRSLPISRMPHAPLLPRVWELRTNMTAYDATYIALAETLNAELWTFDKKYSATPNHTAKIRLFPGPVIVTLL